MEKFTRNFLLGEHSIVRFLRKIGLGLALVLWTTLAFAQEAQDTYHLKVASWDSCYQTDNVYSVPVTMKDFMKIKKFGFVLNYTNTTDFDFIGLTKVNTSVSTMTVQQLTDGNLTFAWESATPVSILPDNSENLLFVLNFKIAGFQHQYLNANKFEFASTLTWTKVEMFSDLGQCEILTENITNGAIKVTEKWQSVMLDIATAKCLGDYVTATVSTPAHESGMVYSFNGSDYNATNKTEVYAPSVDNMLTIKDAKCISYVKKFDVKALEQLTFTVATPVITVCPGGLGDIEILASKGTAPYTYYVIPETQWSAGDNMEDKLEAGNVSLLSKYTYPNYVVQVPAGTVATPTYYWVAVQDANGCATITGSNMLSWWKKVAVIDDKTPLKVTTNPETVLTTTCYEQPDGRISFTITGGTPFEDGYNISRNGMYLGKDFVYDSNVWEDCEGEPCNHAVLPVGCYKFTITDAVGCSKEVEYCVKQPKKIVFNVDHTDAGCGQPVGKLWIASVDDSSGSGATSTWRWHYTTDPTWRTNVSPWFSISTVVTNVPAGVYYVELEDGNECPQEWANAAGDNAIKVLTTEFKITYTPIKCFGNLTTVRIDLISGDANHTFQYMMEKWVCTGGGESVSCTWQWQTVGAGWQTSNVFTGIAGDVNYRYSVKDVTAQGCVISWEQIIPNPPVLQAEILTADSKLPTCPGDNNGIFYVRAWGGNPGTNNSYNFQIDNDPTLRTTNYFLVGSGTHTITVTDSKGCTASVVLDIPNGDNFIDFVNTINVVCAGDEVNLFNASNETNTSTWHDQAGLDGGYLNTYRWYPDGVTHGDATGILLYSYWTSGGDWTSVFSQGQVKKRNPKLFISSQVCKNAADVFATGEIVGPSSTFTAGKYYLAAKDEFGCISNMDSIMIVEPKPLAVTYTKKNAECFGTWSGEIKVMAPKTTGKMQIPNSGGAYYQFVILQKPDIFNVPNWDVNQVTWTKFQNNNNAADDSTLTLALQKGTYWIAVRDYCALHDPSQIKIINEIIIDGKDAIAAKVTVNNVLCYGEKNGSIVVSNAAGGFGGYTYQLDLVPTATGWPKSNSTGIFTDLYAGEYKVTVKDAQNCAPYVKTVTVTQPARLALELSGVDVSCKSAQDGIIRYNIVGGTAPFKESTNNGANWYSIVENTRKFDRRAGAGKYDVWIMDANGCTATATITLIEPAVLNITSTVVTNVSCPPAQETNCKFTNVTNDGAIKVYFSGGWNANDVFNYYVVAKKGDVTITTTINGPIGSSTYANFTGLTAGEWTITLYEWSPTIPFDKPYITNPLYATAYASGFVPTRPDAVPNPQQNPDVEVCKVTQTVVVGAPNPITYDVEYLPVLCKDTDSGEIHVHNVAGGTGPYFFMLEGPAGYAGNGLWKPVTTGVMEYLFTGLPWGHYNVFIKDSKGCVVCLESGEVNNVKNLTLMVSRVKDADCYDTATGQIKLEATSFPTGYTLQYAIELASDVEQFLFPLADQDFIDDLEWQDSPLFNVKSGVWIGYVKATSPDGRGSCFQGHSTDANGTRILNHRIFIDQPSEVVGYVWDKFSVKALCFGDANGKIKVSDVFGGSAMGYSAHVVGTTFDGTAVVKWYSNVDAGDYLEGLYASTLKTDTTKMVDADYYTVTFLDSKGCMSAPKKVAVQQPEKFEIELVLKQDAFICPEDLAGVFEIRIVSGGTGTVVYKYEAWEGTTMKLSSPYGAINTFQGPAGLLYKGWAKDANGCVAYAEKFVAKPIKASFAVFDRTCFNDQFGTAVVKMQVSDPARKYMVRYYKLRSGAWALQQDWSAEFTDSIRITGLTYGDEVSTDKGHFKWEVKDNLGCNTAPVENTFVRVQTQLKTCCATVVPGECSGTLSITITGGVTPYTIFVDGKAVTGASWTLPAGAHVVKVVDANLCSSELPVTIDANPVSRTASAVAYIDEKVKFTDAEAKLDTMLAKGTHTFKYMFTNGCERTLVVTVTEQYRTATIAEVQGTGEVSPLKDLPRQITGTVTAVVPGVGYFVQDARDAVNGRCGIFVADTKTVVLENTGVKVGGVVKELNDVTTLEAAVVEIVQGTAYDPIVLASPADGKNEKWESVLVQVVGARFQGTVNPDGSWVIKTTETNSIVVNDWMFSYTPVDGHYFTVTGVINGANSLYKLEPRKAADVIDLTKTTPVLDIDNLQFKVYPNPFNDHLTITNSDRLSRVTITNIAGQRVMDIQYPDGEIRTSNLVSGVYVITLFTDEGIAKSERMVKR